MIQYFCSQCGEPVSDELQEPVLETGAIVTCAKCSVQSAFFITLVSPYGKEQDQQFSDEFVGSFLFLNREEQ